MTLIEHIDELDKMIVSGASVDKIRSQIAFVQREVTQLEQSHAHLQDAHVKFQEAHQQSASQPAATVVERRLSPRERGLSAL